MSQGQVRQFVDYSVGTGGDIGTNDPGSILPLVTGEDLIQANMLRPGENLRQRTEEISAIDEDTLYLRDADRGFVIAGPGLVSWPGPAPGGVGEGVLSLSDVLYLLPVLTPGSAENPPVPPVASTPGTITLLRVSGGTTDGIIVRSLRYDWQGGSKISITVVFGGTAGTAVAQLLTDVHQRTILLTANAAPLSVVITALNNLVADSNGEFILLTQLVNAALAPSAAGSDILLTPQSKQYMAGNYDSEAHVILPANLSTFFGIAGNPLKEGDSLCIQYAKMIDDVAASHAGRRQSMVEYGNTAIPASAFFNSRVNPERLVNAIPIGKVINGRFVFFTGQQIPAGATNIDLCGLSGSGALIKANDGDLRTLIQTQDSAGNQRFLVDHNGLPLMSVNALNELWVDDGSLETTPNTGTSLFGNRWTVASDQSAAARYASLGPSPVYLSPVWRLLNNTTTSGQKTWARSTGKIIGRRDGAVLVCEWPVGVETNLNTTWMHGFFDEVTTDPLLNSTHYLWFSASNGGNWLLNCAGATPNLDLGVAPLYAATTYQNFRVEIYGASTPDGTGNTLTPPLSTCTIKVYINGVLKRALTGAPWDSTGVYFGYYGKNLGVMAGASSMCIGPVRFTWNMYDSPMY